MGAIEELISALTTGRNAVTAKRKLIRPIKYRSRSGKIFNNKNDAIEDNKRYMRAPNTYRLSERINSTDNGVASDYIPYIKSKGITLTNAGRATGAHLSTNLLDSIAKYSTMTGLPFETALGLAVKESTLGNPTYGGYIKRDIRQSINNGKNVFAGNLISWDGFINPYWTLRQSIADRVKRGKINERDVEKYIGWELPAADKQYNNIKKYTIGPALQQGFNFYKDYPNRYNPGMPNYPLYVQRSGNEALGSPEIQHWMTGTNYLDSNTKNRLIK